MNSVQPRQLGLYSTHTHTHRRTQHRHKTQTGPSCQVQAEGGDQVGGVLRQQAEGLHKVRGARGVTRTQGISSQSARRAQLSKLSSLHCCRSVQLQVVAVCEFCNPKPLNLTLNPNPFPSAPPPPPHLHCCCHLIEEAPGRLVPQHAKPQHQLDQLKTAELRQVGCQAGGVVVHPSREGNAAVDVSVCGEGGAHTWGTARGAAGVKTRQAQVCVCVRRGGCAARGKGDVCVTTE